MSDAATSEPEKKPEEEPKEEEAEEEDDGEEEEEEEEYVIERILKQKLIAGETQYLVKWRGYDNADDNTWETAENLEDTLALEVWMAQKAPVDAEEAEALRRRQRRRRRQRGRRRVQPGRRRRRRRRRRGPARP